MEHSYSKDVHPKGNVEVIATRSILIPRPPQCPSCYQHTSNDDILAKLENHQTDAYFDQLPPVINDSIAKMAMEETEKLAKSVKNNNADDEDWDLKVNKLGWSKQQLQLYRQVSNILDYDQLARLAVNGRTNEGIIRRCSIEKSVARMRMALASVHWNTELTQWLNLIMLTYLPPTYMASYLDILQTLRAKVPTLVDKMLAGRPASFNQDYLQAIIKKPYGANVPSKSRKLPGQSPIIVIVPSTLNSTTQQPTPRMKRWFSLIGTMASTAPILHTMRQTQTLESVTEQLVAMTRSKIQDLRNEMPNRHIILVGINIGAAIAMQVALVETVSSVVCMGFAFNTVKGTRGAPDDKILEITTPVLFVLGENSARSSQEEIESLRERMSAQTSLVVVGSADDALRINKFNRHLEGVTQSMVDNMIADEIQDFVSTCILNPPGPRKITNHLSKRSIGASSLKKHDSTRKRKHKDGNKPDKGPPRKVGRPRLNRSNEIPTGDLKPEKPKQTQALLKQSSKMPVQNIIPVTEVPTLATEVVTITTSDTTNVPMPIVITDNGVNLNVSNTQEVVTTTEIEKIPEIITIPPAVATIPPAVVTIPPAVTTIPPPKIIQSAGQFVQVKPPTTSGRVQSPNVKNFFIRKGIEKQPSNQIVTSPAGTTFITTQCTPTPQPSIGQLPSNKKIIIKSQQILVPANNVKTNPAPIIQVPGQQNISTSQSTISLNESVLDTSANDLSGILDLPILFADNNDSPIIDQTKPILNTTATSTQILNTSGSSTQILNTSGTSAQILNTSGSSSQILNTSGSSTQILNTSGSTAQILSTSSPQVFTTSNSSQILNTSGSSTHLLNTSLPSNIIMTTAADRNASIVSPSNIFITNADGKLPNRPVVISAAKVGAKPLQQTAVATTPTHNKVIFINRNQIQQKIVGTPSGTPIVKGLQTLKLVPTSLGASTQSTPITLQGNQLTKLSPGTKIDLSTLKLVKNPTTNMTGNIVKPLIINKSVTGAKNSIVIKSPMRTNVQPVQGNPAIIKANVLNRNITVKKLMNVVPTIKPISTPPVVISSVNTSPKQSEPSTSLSMAKSPVSATTTSPTTSSTPTKVTRKTRNSN